MEMLLRNIPNDYKYKKEYLDNNSKEIEILFLGSSHTYYGINPEFISENAFNAGHISQTIDLDYKILKKYENNWNKLKCIVILIDYFTLFSRLSSGIEYWRIKNYNIYYKMNLSNNLSDNSELLSVNFRSNLKRIASFYIFNNTPVSCSKLGFGENHKKNKNLIETGKSAAKRHTEKDLSELQESIRIINSILKMASKNNAKVIFYTSPAYRTYISNLNKNQLNLTINTIKKLSDNKDNCLYVNFLNNSSFLAEDFRDADHLNKKGAKKLTKQLYRIINEK